MKKIIMFYSLILIIYSNAMSQDTILILQNIKTGKEKVLIEGTKIKSTLKDGKIYKGELKATYVSKGLDTCQTIMIDKVVLNLNDIQEIQIQHLFWRVTGTIMAISGGGITIYGLNFLFSSQQGLP